MKDIISAGGIIVNEKSQVVLIQNQRGKWGFPKGHLERGEDGLTAAKREIHEEAGIAKLELIKELGLLLHMKPSIIEKSNTNEFKYIQMFLFKSDQEKIEPNDSEIQKASWIALESVSNLLKYKEDRQFYQDHFEEIKSAI